MTMDQPQPNCFEIRFRLEDKEITQFIPLTVLKAAPDAAAHIGVVAVSAYQVLTGGSV